MSANPACSMPLSRGERRFVAASPAHRVDLVESEWCSKGCRSLRTRRLRPPTTRSSSWAQSPASRRMATADADAATAILAEGWTNGRPGPGAQLADQVPSWWWATRRIFGRGDARPAARTRRDGQSMLRSVARHGDGLKALATACSAAAANSLGSWPGGGADGRQRDLARRRRRQPGRGAWRPPPSSLPYDFWTIICARPPKSRRDHRRGGHRSGGSIGFSPAFCNGANEAEAAGVEQDGSEHVAAQRP